MRSTDECWRRLLAALVSLRLGTGISCIALRRLTDAGVEAYLYVPSLLSQVSRMIFPSRMELWSQQAGLFLI